VNDAHGHMVGDNVLKEVAARIQALLRATKI
jgi:GGDEF domain-containing protein